MMYIADFHIHSKYSRATSKECVPEILEIWARRKGIGVIGTGDFTHPAWREELKEKLVPSGDGLYVLKNEFCQKDQVAGGDFHPHFIVSGEISSIYKKGGKVRKVHNLILLPSLEDAELISQRLEAIGNVWSDGRPILGLDSRDLLEIVLDICPEAIFIPAHIWTPHFSLFGAYSGFDDIEECFEDLTGYIYALETGLSSDPTMNWRLSALDRFALVSNSDAHSPGNLSREANIFNTELSYQAMLKALKNPGTGEFSGTIEFFPEEGKYHYDGHRNCKVCWKPSDTKAAGGVCPVCGGRITVGVLHRVEALADREEGFMPTGAKPFERLIPLREVIASSIGATSTSNKVKGKYLDLVRNLGPELWILREALLEDIKLAAGPHITEGIRRLRSGQVEIQPGFDGEYGKIKILSTSEITKLSGQLSLMNDQSTEVQGSRMSPQPAKPAPPVVDQDLPKSSRRAKPVSPHILYGLNEEQWGAVSSSAPAISVIAGPGTGKTKTLVSRISYLVEKCGIPPGQITAVTFTNKAAHEMRIRLDKYFGDKKTAGAITIGTFHSICLEILSRGKNNNRIAVIDEYQALSFIDEIVKSMNLTISPREALRGISLIKSGALSGEDGLNSKMPSRVYDAYCAQLQNYGVMDYDDILLQALQQVEDKEIEDHFSHLLVDEFQDINEIQYRLIQAWSRKSKAVFIIGDPDQSIYGFRGSDIRYFDRFHQDFPGIEEIYLTQNYRSTPEIIVSAKAVITRQGAEGRAGSLEATRKNGAKVRLIETKDGFSEALFVAKEINRMVGGMDMLDTQALSAPQGKRPRTKHSVGFSDLALLYRTNRQAAMLEECLAKEGIPYVVVGRDEFLSDQLVRQSLAFFRFLLNPGDMASLLLCLKAESISLEEPDQKILESYIKGEKSVSTLIHMMEEAQLFPDKPGQSLNFLEKLKKYQPMMRKDKPGDIMDSWINDNHLSGIRSMELLLNMSVMYQEMSSFIQNLVLGRESDIVRSGSKMYHPDAVSLMTIHGAKGLEFPVVFICGVNEGIIPLKNSSSDANIDEERRLFYVGMTRARDELVLVTSRTPSPFIGDITEEQMVIEHGGLQKQGPQYKQVSLFEM